MSAPHVRASPAAVDRTPAKVTRRHRTVGLVTLKRWLRDSNQSVTELAERCARHSKMVAAGRGHVRRARDAIYAILEGRTREPSVPLAVALRDEARVPFESWCDNV
jgi:hypothetical protein